MSSRLSSASPADASSHHKTTVKDLARCGMSEDPRSEREEGGSLACISVGLYHLLAAESKPGEVWTGRVGSSLTWNHICQVETTGVLFYTWNQTLSLLSGDGSIEEEDWGALRRALSERQEERSYTHKGKNLNVSESVAMLMRCALCPTKLKPVVSRSSYCGVAQRSLCDPCRGMCSVKKIIHMQQALSSSTL